MKKNGKFVFGLLSAAAVAGGAYYFVKKFLNKDSKDDFDDFEDDFEDFDFDDDETEVPSEGREYVTLNMTSPVEETVPTEAENVCTCEPEEEITDAFIITEEEMEDAEDVFEEESSEEPEDTVIATDETDITEE